MLALTVAVTLSADDRDALVALEYAASVTSSATASETKWIPSLRWKLANLENHRNRRTGDFERQAKALEDSME